MVAHEAEGEGIVFGGLVALYAPPQLGSAAPPPQHVGTDALWVLHTGLPGGSGCAWTSPAHVGASPSARIGHCAALRELGGGAALVYVYGGFVPDLVVDSAMPLGAHGDADVDERGAAAHEKPTLTCTPPNAGSYLNDLSILSLPGWEWSRPSVAVDNCNPPACISATLTSLGRGSPYMLLFGGVTRGAPTNAALLVDTDALCMRELRAWRQGNPSGPALPPITRRSLVHKRSSTFEERVALDSCVLGAGVPEHVRASPAHLAASRCNHTATLVHDETVLIYGGASGEWEYDSVITLDARSLEWRSVEGVGGTLPLPRQRHAAVATRGGLLVLGGSCGERLLSEVHLLRTPRIGPGSGAAQGHDPSDTMHPPLTAPTGLLPPHATNEMATAGAASAAAFKPPPMPPPMPPPTHALPQAGLPPPPAALPTAAPPPPPPPGGPPPLSARYHSAPLPPSACLAAPPVPQHSASAAAASAAAAAAAAAYQCPVWEAAHGAACSTFETRSAFGGSECGSSRIGEGGRMLGGSLTRSAAADLTGEALQHVRHLASEMSQDVSREVGREVSAEVSRQLGRELSRELGREVREACREVGSRLSTEFAPELQRLRLAADAAEARSSELTRLHQHFAARPAEQYGGGRYPEQYGGGRYPERGPEGHYPAYPERGAGMMNGAEMGGTGMMMGAEMGGATLAQLHADLAAAQEQLASVRGEAEHWRRLHGAEASRCRQLERAKEELIARVQAAEAQTLGQTAHRAPPQAPGRAPPRAPPQAFAQQPVPLYAQQSAPLYAPLAAQQLAPLAAQPPAQPAPWLGSCGEPPTLTPTRLQPPPPPQPPPPLHQQPPQPPLPLPPPHEQYQSVWPAEAERAMLGTSGIAPADVRPAVVAQVSEPSAEEAAAMSAVDAILKEPPLLGEELLPGAELPPGAELLPGAEGESPGSLLAAPSPPGSSFSVGELPQGDDLDVAEIAAELGPT